MTEIDGDKVVIPAQKSLDLIDNFLSIRDHTHVKNSVPYPIAGINEGF